MLPNKKCSCCQVEKEIIEFNKFARNKDGLDSNCKKCRAEKSKSYRTRNADKIKQTRKKHYQKNIEKMRAEKRRYGAKSKDQKREYDKKYRPQNKEKIKQYKKDWENKNKDNPILKIKKNLRRRLCHALNGNLKAENTLKLLGCSAEEFKLYLESLFLEGMSWYNYGLRGWHIDHIIPCSAFDLSKEEDQRKCFHFSNMRPLWGKDNLKKAYMYNGQNCRLAEDKSLIPKNLNVLS